MALTVGILSMRVSDEERRHLEDVYTWIRSDKETVVERLAHWTPDQKVPGSNPVRGLNFRVSESALSTAP